MNAVMTTRCLEIGKLPKELRHFQVIARHDSNVLLPADSICNRTHGNVAHEFCFPQLLARLSIEGPELLTHIPVENKPSGSRQHGAIAGHAADIELQHFAG